MRDADPFLSAFHQADVAGAVRALDEGGVLTSLFPEFARNRTLTLDERWNGDDPIGTVMYRGLGVYQSLTAGDAAPPSHLRVVAPMAAFLAYIGRKPTESSDSADRHHGQRVELPLNADGFRRVRYSGYEQAGAHIFAERMTELSDLASPDLQLTPGTIAVGRSYIRLLTQPLQIARQADERLVEARCRDLLQRLYPNAALNERLPLDEVVRCFQRLAIMRYELANPSAIEQRDEGKRWDRWQEIWSSLKPRLDRVFAELHARVPAFERVLQQRLEVPLIGGSDWAELDIPQEQRAAARRFVQLQLRPDIERREALEAVSSAFSSRPLDTATLQRIAYAHGGYRNGTARFYGLVNDHHYTDPSGRYSAYYFRSEPLRQFPKDSDLRELQDHLRTHSYPAVTRWLAAIQSESPEKPISLLHSLICRGPFANLPELEAYLLRHSVDPLEVAKGYASQAKLVHIVTTAAAGSREIDVYHGFQSTQDHSGSGWWHALEQRWPELDRYLRAPQESDNALARRFLEDGIVFVGGSSELCFPEPRNPDRFVRIIGPMQSASPYLTLILDRLHPENPKALRFVTAYFHRNAARMRSTVRAALASLQDAEAWALADHCFAGWGLAPATPDADG